MTDSTGSNTIEQLVDQLALASTLCDVGDLGELARMHTQIGHLTKQIEEMSDLAHAEEFGPFGSAVGTLIEGIVLETYDDLEDVLEKVRKAISEIQSALKADPSSAPLPKDKDFVDQLVALAGAEFSALPEPTAEGTGQDEASDDEAMPSGGADEGSLDHADPSANGSQDETDSDGDEEPYVAEPLLISGDELEYVQSFVTEAYEHIDAIEAAVLDLEQALDDQAKINDLFRPFHTIKGMAGFLNLRDVQELTHKGETLLDLARKAQLKLTNNHIDLIFDTVDILKEQVEAIAEHIANPTDEPIPQPDISQALVVLEKAAKGDPGNTFKDALRNPAAGDDASTTPAPAQPAEVTSPADATDAEEEPDPPSPAAAAEGDLGDATKAETGAGAANPAKAKGGTKKDLTVRLETAKLDHLVNMVGELVIAQAMVSQNALLNESEKLSRDVSQVTKITREVQEITMAMRMVTLHQTFQKMARLARDVARKAGKKVGFSISGEDTELDKNVIDEIGDPLMHMVRNSVDHGIEVPDERLAAGKSETGEVHLHAAHEGGNIVIEITDDGRGLDRDKLIAKAIERGLISPDDQLSDQEAFALIMQAGFSTAEKITDISGRGVGMDVVKRNIEKLRGKVEISSEKGKGSKFTIRLPLTLAIIDGMVVTVGEERFIIPTIAIDQSLRPEQEQVTTVQKRGEMLMVRGELCPLIRLDKLFALPTEDRPVWERMVVIVVVDGRRVGIVLDDLIGQQQIVIKALGDQFQEVAGISGGAILGDGRVGLILDAPGLVEMHNGTVSK